MKGNLSRSVPLLILYSLSGYANGVSTKLLESQIQAQILTYLQNIPGIFCWRCNNGAIFDPSRRIFRAHSKFTPKGIPDIIGVINIPPHSGRMFAIEVKRPGNKPSEDQFHIIERLRSRGAIAFVAYSLDDAINGLGLRSSLEMPDHSL